MMYLPNPMTRHSKTVNEARESKQSRPRKHSWSNKGPSEFVAIAFLFTLALGSLNANLLIILLKSGKVFTSFTELSFFHPFSHIPVHESTLTVHKVELMINAREDFSNGGGVADHAASTHDLCQVATWNHCGWLVIDTTLEACGRPIHELNRALCLDCSNGCIDIFRHHIAAIHHATSHVLAMAWIALHEHRCGFKHRHCD